MCLHVCESHANTHKVFLFHPDNHFCLASISRAELEISRRLEESMCLSITHLSKVIGNKITSMLGIICSLKKLIQSLVLGIV